MNPLQGKRDQRSANTPVDIKQPNFLVLISDGFMEARAALSRTGFAPSHNPVAALPPCSGPATSLPPGGYLSIPLVLDFVMIR